MTIDVQVIDVTDLPKPSIRVYQMADEALRTLDMTPAEKSQWVQDHPTWREYLRAVIEVATYEEMIEQRLNALKPVPLFELGDIYATPAALLTLVQLDIDPADLLNRHQTGDWGDLDLEDREANDMSVNDGTRILSAYKVTTGKVWIITEADRAMTTILLPEEY